MEDFKFDSIEEALKDFAAGKPLIVADDEDRENEGDLICSGQMVTPEIIKFMAENYPNLAKYVKDLDVCMPWARMFETELKLYFNE